MFDVFVESLNSWCRTKGWKVQFELGQFGRRVSFLDMTTYWTENGKTRIGDNARATSIFAENGHVYMSGTIGGVTTAGIWVDGEWSPLSQQEAVIADIFVEDGHVYLAGAYGLSELAAIWIDYNLIEVEDPAVVAELSIAQHIALSQWVAFFAQHYLS